MSTLIALFTLVVIVLPSAAAAGKVEVGDSITAGIRTEVEHDGRPFGYRVTWIAWDSHFRDSDLRLGDKILGVNNYRYTRQAFPRHHAIGDYLESGYWEEQGAKDGEPVTLIVHRDGTEISVPGRVRANRFYYNDDGKQTMDLGGPERRSREKDGNGRPIFDRDWAQWYEQETNGKPGSYPYILDGAWERSLTFNNRRELKNHLADKERIDYLVANYLCTFCETMSEDWERVRDNLDGEPVELAEDALDYRTRQEELRKEIKGYTGEAIAAFEAELGERLEHAPSVGSGGIEEQREAYVGKVVYFDGLTQRNLVNDLEQTFMVAGGPRQGYYFLAAESPVMARVFDSLYRYRALVNPRLAERYSVYIEVLDEPRIITFRGSPVMGLLGTVVGLAGGRNDVFVDARPTEGELVFAGEKETKVEPSCAIAAGDPPEATIACMVEAIKNGDRDTWQILFAEWRFMSMGQGLRPIFYPDYRVRRAIFESAWQHSRKIILDKVYHARVNRADQFELLYEPGEDDTIPKVESARVVLDYVGFFDGEHRTFVNLEVRRVWQLQRLDGGPWKITEARHL